MRKTQQYSQHTTRILEKLLVADLDSHTIVTNKKQLGELKELISRFEFALQLKQ